MLNERKEALLFPDDSLSLFEKLPKLRLLSFICPYILHTLFRDGKFHTSEPMSRYLKR
jgi:hypothetical protein